MPAKDSPKPTPSELEYLAVLWEHGPSTVRAVHDILLQRKKEVQYTTVLKTLQTMHDRDLVKRDESQRSHIYRANRSESELRRRWTTGSAVASVVDHLFSGTVGDLVLRMLSRYRSTPEELEEIRRKVEQLRQEEQKGCDQP